MRAKRTGEPCTQCGGDHKDWRGNRGCSGHLSSDNTTACRRPTIAGGEVCLFHGGARTVVQANAAQRAFLARASGQVGQLLAECDLPEQHPIDGLLEVVRHSGAMMRLLGYIVSELDTHRDDGQHKMGLDALVGFDSNMEQAANVWTRLYGEWSDRYARACKLALDANIDERLVRNAEATTSVFLDAFQEALKEADLDPAQAQRFTTVLASKLRKVQGPLDARSLI